MPNRYIRTVFELDGDKEYKESIRAINAEQKKYNSELEITKTAYATSANSMDALLAKQKNYNDIIENLNKKQEAQKTHLTEAREAVEKYTTQLEKLNSEHESILQTYGKTSQEFKEHSAAIEQTEKYLQRAQNAENTYTTALNKTTVELGKYSVEQNKNNGYLKEAVLRADGCTTSIDEYGKEVKRVVPEQQNMNTALETLSRVLIAAGIQKGFNELVDLLKDTVAASIEFESAYTGVIKTVEGTPEQLQRISDGIKKLSTEIPATTTQIAAVAEAAGQLGIETDSVLDFTEVMIKLGTTTNLSAEQAASALAKFANITKTNAADYERLGSVIVALGNNFATTESDIVNMATRLASTGEIIGLSEAQIMGVATALSSVGIEAEAGGSAISKVLKNIELAVATNSDALTDYASVAGVSAAEFSRAWGEDAVSALSMFIDGLNDTERNGKTAIEILDEMGLTEVRLSNAILALASSEGILNDAVALSNQAWIDNTALMNEAELRFGTTESKMQLLKNSTDLLKIAIGDQLNPTVNNLIGIGDGMVKGLTEWVQANEWLVPTITALTVGLGTMITTVTAATTVVKAFSVASAAMGGAFPIVAVASFMTGLISLQLTMQETSDAAEEIKQKNNDLIDSTNQVISRVESSRQAYSDATEAIESNSNETIKLAKRLEELIEQEELSNAETTELKHIIDQLNSALPTLALSFDNASGSVRGYTGNIYDLIEAKRQLMAYESAESRYIEALDTRDTLKEQIENVKTQRTEMEKIVADFEKINPNWKQDIGSFEIEGYDAFEQARFALENINESYIDLVKHQSQNRAEIKELETVIDDYTESLGDNTEKTENNTKATNTNTTAQNNHKKSIEDSKKTSDEYNKTLKEHSSELKNVESNLNLVETEIKGSANSYDSLAKKQQAQIDLYKAQERGINILEEARDSELATLNEYDTKVAETLELQTKANEEYEARARLLGEDSIKTQEQKEKLEELNAQLEENTKVRDEAKEKYTEYNTEVNKAVSAHIELDRELQATAGYMDEAANSSTGLATTLDENGNVIKKSAASTSSALKEQEKATKAAEKAQKDLEKAAKESAKEQEEAIKAAVEPIDASMKGIEKSAESLIKAYESTYEAARSNFDKQLDYFKKSYLQSQDVLEDIYNNMKSHTGDLSTQQDDLAKALSLGFDEKFIAELLDKGEEGRQAINKLVNSYNEATGKITAGKQQLTVDDYNWQFKQSKEMSDSLAKTVAEMKTGFSEKAAEILDEAKLLGDGISENTEEAFVELKDRVDKVMSDLSALTKTKGEETVQGLIDGVEEKAPEAETAVSELAEDVEETFAGEPQKFFENGKNIVQGLIDGLDDMKPYATANMTALAQALLKAFNDALIIQSPSKKMYESGENVVRGVADGIEDSIPTAQLSLLQLGEALMESANRIADHDYWSNLELPVSELIEKQSDHARNLLSMALMDGGIQLRAVEALLTDAIDNQDFTRMREVIEKFGLLYSDFVDTGRMFEWEDEMIGFTPFEGMLDKMRASMKGIIPDAEVLKIIDSMFPNMERVDSYAPWLEEVSQPWLRAREIVSQQIYQMKEETVNALTGYYHTLNEATGEIMKKAKYEDVVRTNTSYITYYGETMEEYKHAMEIARTAWETGGEAWEVYENHILQQGKVVDLQQQINDQFDRMTQSGQTDKETGITTYAESAVAAFEALQEELRKAQIELAATGIEFNKLGEAIENGTVDALYSVTEGLEETGLIIRDVLINAADTEEWGKYAAQMAAEGFTVGIYDEYGNLIDAAKYFTEGIKETIETELDIKSPSGVFKRYGKNSAEGYYIGLVDEMHKQLGKFKMNTPELTAKIEEYASIQAMPTPSLDNIVNNSSIVHENSRTFSPNIYITPQSHQSEYAIAQQIIEQERRALYG